MSKKITTFSVSSYQEVLDLVPQLAQAFIDRGLVVIKGHEFSSEEHKNLAKLLGDIFGWNVCSEALESTIDAAYHKGGQSTSDDYDYHLVEKDHYILDWHIEQIYYVYPPLAGVWYMDEIISPEGTGATRFVDSSDLLEKFSKEDQDFLSKAVAIWDKPLPNGRGPFYTKVVEQYDLINKPLLRVETDNGCYIKPTLYSLDGKAPTELEIQRFADLTVKIKEILINDEDIRYSQNWRSGDLLIVDLFRMYHAVMGGFSYGDRKMSLIATNKRVVENSFYNIKPELIAE